MVVCKSTINNCVEMIINFENHVFQVTEVNNLIKSVFDEAFYFIKVEGEIVDVSRSKNNHIYFSIKDLLLSCK